MARYSVVALAFSLTTFAAASRDAAPTYMEAAPILSAHCTGCHRAGDIAPMPLTTYNEVRPWARAIRQALLLHRMPPWHAEPNREHPFRNDRSLNAADVATLTRWVDAGAPEGPKLPPGETAPLQVPGEAHLNSSPDDISIQIPGFAVPASGSLPYSFLIVPLHLDHDVWVRSAEYRIDQRRVIHHINAFVRPRGSSFLANFPANQIFSPTVAQRAVRKSDEKTFDRRELLLGYEPGYRAAPWLEDGGKLLRAGSDVVFELHYNPNGKPVVDRSSLVLHLTSAPPRYRVLAIDTLRDLDLKIPPGVAEYRSNASMTLAKPVRLLSVQPHMHYRGKSMLVQAFLPNGQCQTLVNVPRYDFNWQTTYTYQDPMTLPAGAKLESTAVFDNSDGNPANPDPKSEVHWGDQTTDEMHIAFLELVIGRDEEPNAIFGTPPKGLTPSTSAASRP